MDNYTTNNKKKYFSDIYILVGLIVALVIDALLWWLLYSNFNNQTEFVPLHYNIYFGIDLYGPWYQILLMPLSGFVFILINAVVSYMVYQRARLISYILIASLVLCEIVFLASGWLIINQLLV
ncbi:hypothetical protein KKG41_03305 [Patescibacteria group bacterium]|nr:hypothetical protein [Patescibacteria group bacterium]MBU1890100.1 hypothetical protein [Patescibacteria group bacterium]